MNTLTLNTKLSRNPDVVHTQIDSDLVIMIPEDHMFYGLNAVGTSIWSLLESNALPILTICKQIQQEYRVTESECIHDVTTFVEEMVEHNLLLALE